MDSFIHDVGFRVFNLGVAARDVSFLALMLPSVPNGNDIYEQTLSRQLVKRPQKNQLDLQIFWRKIIVLQYFDFKGKVHLHTAGQKCERISTWFIASGRA